MPLASLVLLSALHSAVSTPAIADPRCEYLVNPNCVDTLAPRLSWTTTTPTQNWMQTGYQVLVASDPSKLKSDEGDLWDTGRVRSDASIQIPYSGKALESRERCFWKVKVWGSDGLVSNWSAPQEWDMGLLKTDDWSGSKWIGGPALPDPAPAPFLRKEFETHGKVQRATLFVSGLAYAEMHLNGKKIGEATERDPGYTNFNKRVLYVAYDVTKAVKPGKNALGAILGTGWYDVHDVATWHFERSPWRDHPKLRAQLIIEYAGARAEVIGSDQTWMTSSGPIITDGIYTGETYDARQEIRGWDTPEFDDRAWKAASQMAAPKGVLAARPCPAVKIWETIKAKKITEPRPGVYVVDFGQNVAGHVRLHVRGIAGDKVTMRYSERVGGNGMIERGEIDVFMKKTSPPQPFQTDTYICGGGNETWEQRFSYSGFRYAEVTGFPGKPSPDNFEERAAGTDFESNGEFSCSNDLLNKIQQATLNAYRSNAQSIPTDCPQREKNGWTGDAQLACEAGLMNFKSATFYSKWLDDLSDDQKDSGAMSLVVPSGGWGQGACHPAWDSAYPIIAWDLYEYRGDTRVLEKHFAGIRRYIDFVERQTTDGVVPFDSLGDWVPWDTKTPSQLTSTIFLFVDERIASDSARLLGNGVDAERYAKLAARTKEAFGRHFLAQGAMNEASQTALSMAVYFSLVDGEQKKAAIDALVRNIDKQGHIDTGILGAKFVLRALSEAGRTDEAYKLVARKEQPGWGWWIEQGATTLWEDWKGESSLNHIMFGDVSNWYFQWLAGIGLDPAAPAFKHVQIHPQPVGDLTWAKASEDGPYGRITSSWRRDGSKFHLEVDIPPNSKAAIWVPGTYGAHEVGSGHYVYDSTLR